MVQAIPDVKDSLWSNEIYKAPKVTYSCIFQFIVDHKVLIKKANHIENVIERRDSSDLGIQTQGNVHSDSDSQGNTNSDTATFESICYTRTLDKAYRFSKMAMYKIIVTILCQVCQIKFALVPPSYHYVQCAYSTVQKDCTRGKSHLCLSS